MESGRFSALLSGAIVSLALASPASADTHTLYAILTGSQEVPPVASNGSGSCVVTLDDVTGAVSVTGSFSGLTSTATMCHIHGLAAPGANAGIIVTLTETGGTAGSISGGGTLTPSHVTGMLGGLTYINVHTTNFGSGEIRGQVTVTVPALPWSYAAVLAALALAGGVFVLGRRHAPSPA